MLIEGKDLSFNRSDLRKILALVFIMVPIVLLWNTPVVYPLKILVVFFHEISHGLASILTGGKMITIELSHHQGGACMTLGGNRFIILSAGYLGSLLWGGIILTAAARTRFDRAITALLGASIVIVGILYVRPIIGFGFAFSLIIGASLVAFARYLPEAANDVLLKVIGLTSCLYAVLDIVSDGISRDIPMSDANALGDMIFLPGWLVSIVWLIVAIAGSAFFLWIAGGGRKTAGPPGAGPTRLPGLE